jgi:ankyrin repeat protein
MLLKNGANPRAAVTGWTPAFYAICLKNYPAVPELAKACLDVNYQDGGGWTLLHLAARTNSKYVLDCLFQLGANPHIKGVSQQVYWKHCHRKSKLLDACEHCVTPLDLARNEGDECLKTFVRAAQEACIDLSLDSDGEAFWPAEEHLQELST